MKAISIGLFAIFLMNGAKGQVYDIKTPNNRLNKTPDTGNHTLDSSNYYIWDMINGVWNIPYKEKYNYDTPGNMILKTSYVKDNNKVLAYSVREQYAYDDGGTMTSSYTYKWNQSTGQ